jgi:capsular polysaccharide biosynthesis protein
MEQNTYENEISLKELLLILKKEFKIIATITATLILLSGIFSFFIAKPVYSSTASIVVKVPETIITKYGEYHLLTNNPNDIISLMKDIELAEKTIKGLNLKISTDSFNNSLSYNSSKDSSKYTVNFKWTDKDNSSTILSTHLNNYIDYINYRFTLSATENFIRDIEKNNSIVAQSINELKDTISYNDEIISSLDNYQPTELKQFNSTNDGIIIAEISNPSYNKLQEELLSQKVQLNNLEQQLSINGSNLKELHVEYKNLLENPNYLVTEKTLNIMEGNIKIFEKAHTPSYPISPNKKLNLAISLVLGLMIGVFVAFFKNYWQNN